MLRHTRNHPSPRAARPHYLKKLLLLPVAGLFMACASCSDAPSKPPPPPVTDLEPIREGLAVLAYAMLGAAVVCVLGRMLK
jgi:hypothetical protein